MVLSEPFHISVHVAIGTWAEGRWVRVVISMLSGSGRKRKGARNELKVLAILERDGYAVTKAGGSLGIWDLIAVRYDAVRLVQVKSNRPAPRPEMESMRAFKVPQNVTKWLVIVRDRQQPEWREIE